MFRIALTLGLLGSLSFGCATTQTKDDVLRLLDEGKYDAARDAAVACLKETPAKPTCHEALVRSYLLRNDLGVELRAAATRCLEAIPEHPPCLSAEGIQSLKNSSFTDALDTLQRMRSIAPQSVDTLVLESAYAAEMKDDKRACAGFHEACKAGDTYACKRADTCTTH